MNICLLNDSFPPVIDGVANVVMNYGRILTENMGENVVVGTPKYPDASYEGYPYKVIPYPSFDTTEFISGYRTGNPLAIREIAQMAEFKPDIIHTHCPAASAIMARILRSETGAPVIFTYHTKFDVDIARAVGDGFLKKETIKTMISNIAACDDVWVVSQGAGDNLRSLGYEGEMHVMNNGVDFPKGRVDADKVKEVVAGFDLPEGLPVFLFVGRIMKYKGLPIIVDAMKILSEKGCDYRCVFVGGGADAEKMQEKVKEYGIPLDVAAEGGKLTSTEGSHKCGKVIFTGPIHNREKLRAWNTRADLFLFPSVYDTNGIVVREAAACGLASVLIKDSCAAEGVTHARNGFLIEENAESMAALLMEVSEDIEHLYQIGQNAMDEIYISWEDAVKTAYDRYAEIHELAVSGELGIRKHQSLDYLMKSAAAILDGTEKAFHAPVVFYDGMRENFEEFRGDLDDKRDELRMDFLIKRDELSKDWKEKRDEINEHIEEFRDGINDKLGFIKENLAETFDIDNDFTDKHDDF
ncbi:MAG: glycosyltransferase [Butyrivibrio sp.]|nr:glycosyltransferase [Butyrivibrio sp.]